MRGIGFASLALGAAFLILGAPLSTRAQVLIAGMTDGQDAVTPDAIKKIEHDIVMPDGAAKIGEYARYYAPGDLAGRKLIVGVYVQKAKLQSARNTDGAKAVDGIDGAFLTTYGKLPRLTGGGCDMVTTYFDPGVQRFFLLQQSGRDAAEARCNG